MSLASFVNRRVAAAAEDDGFTLVEVIAALVVFALSASMALALLLSAVRAGYVSKSDTEGRNLTQAKVEELRNLPFHIDQAVSTEYDLLDLYYPNRSGSGAAVGVTGYVPSTATSSTYRSTTLGDPASGAFFRTVIDPVPGYSRFKQYVTVQFVNATGTAVSPQSTWSATTAGSDTPVTNQVNVSVTTLWSVGSTARNYNMFTSISAGRPITPRVNMQAHALGIDVTGLLPAIDGGTTATGTFDATDLALNASFSNIVTAGATATSALAKIEGGASITGAQTSVKAPPNVGPVSSGTVSAPSPLQYDSEPFAQFASTDYANISAGSASGQPYAGSSSTPLRTDLYSGGSGSVAASYTDQPSSSHLRLSTSSPVMRIPNVSGGAAVMSASGYATSATSGTSHSATSVLSGLSSTTIQLFPTDQAPNGVVQITITSASLTCTSGANWGSTSTASATLAYSATVSYAVWNGSSVSYQSVALDATKSSDPLASIPLTTQVGVGGDGLPLFLGDYIASWSSVTAGEAASGVRTSSDNKSVSADYAGLITLNTQPLRDGDPDSSVGITVGAMSCLAEDYR